MGRQSMTGVAIMVFILLVGLPVTFVISGAMIALALSRFFPDDDDAPTPSSAGEHLLGPVY